MNWNAYGGIVKAAGSLRRYYHLPVYHGTDTTIDRWLEKGSFRCIIALLIDAMGSSVLAKHLSDQNFFRAHTVENITTVFPPTTTAATTAFRTGRTPAENGWLGWNQYFNEKDDNIILFLNRSQYQEQKYPDFSYRTLPVSFITDELNQNGLKSENIWPAWGSENNTYEEMLGRISNAAEDSSIHFIYGYWDYLDTLMHRVGPSSEKAGDELRKIESLTQQFARSLPSDCGLLITADHSQIDAAHALISNELTSMFRHAPALEPRTTAFYIKPEYKNEFTQKFNLLYGSSFHLYTHEEVMKQHIFGEGIPHARFEEFIGDYLAVGTGNMQLLYGSKKYSLGDHAGGLMEEALIPVILYP